jgi:phosphomecalonate degydratase small subunit
VTLKIIVKGKADGITLVAKNPVNFLGAVDKKTGIVRDEKHDLFGKSLGEKILVFPFGIGSSVGAYTIYSLKVNKCAPLAMICLKADLTTASGCALANIPLVVASKDEYNSINDGKKILLDAETGKML